MVIFHDIVLRGAFAKGLFPIPTDAFIVHLFSSYLTSLPFCCAAASDRSGATMIIPRDVILFAGVLKQSFALNSSDVFVVT